VPTEDGAIQWNATYATVRAIVASNGSDEKQRCCNVTRTVYAGGARVAKVQQSRYVEKSKQL
jgi:hypothetical protein